MSTEKATLADVDGRTPGRAVLLQIDLDNPDGPQGGPFFTPYTEGEHGCTDPYESCVRMWESIGGDWPAHTHAIVGNARAKYLRWAARMADMGFSEDSYTPEQYLCDTMEVPR